MEICFPDELKRLAALFPLPLYAVGGQIRNPLLGLPVSDMDICSALPPEQVIELCVKNGLSYVPQGLKYGTVAIHMNGCVFEHTSFRRESYSQGGAHRPEKVSFGADINEDAFRRDFTVNALYMEILDEEKRVIDPTGLGLSDLKAGLIRATSPDPSVILRDDALRIMRLPRFAAELGFSVEENTLHAAKKYARGLKDVSRERIQSELNKILLSDIRYSPERRASCRHELPVENAAVCARGQFEEQAEEYDSPERRASCRHELPAENAAVCARGQFEEQAEEYDSPERRASCRHELSRKNAELCPPGEDSPVYRGLEILRELCAFDYFLPELSACAGVSQRPQYHAYDVMEHCLHSCALIGAGADMAKDELLTLRLSALLHDIGKPEAKRRNENIPQAHGHMYDHDRIGEEMARAALTALRYPALLTASVCSLIRRHMFDLTGTAKESTLRENFALWGYDESLRLVYMRRADVYGSGLTPLDEKVATAERFLRALEKMKSEGAPFSESELCCSGSDIMEWTALPPSPRIGEIKLSLLKHCARKPADNNREKLKRLCSDICDERKI